MFQEPEELPDQREQADSPEQAENLEQTDNSEECESPEQAMAVDETPSAAAMFGIKTPEMLLRETRKMQNVAKQTLDLFQGKMEQVLQRNRESELKRTKKRIEEKLAAIKQLNQKISEYMIQVNTPCSEVAEFNFQSDSDLDVYEDSICDIEDALQRFTTNKSPEVKEIKPGAIQQQKAKLPKLQISKYAGEPLKWREFWEQFDSNIHSSSLEATTKFSYLRELLVGKASAVIRGLSLSACNYEVAIKLLNKEFGDDTKLRSAHIKAIREVQPVSSPHNLKLLRRFYEEVSINYASLKSMGYEGHVMCLVEETVMKLPRAIRYEITREDRSWTKWDFTKFLEHLWIYLKTCEEIEPVESSRLEQSPSRRQLITTTTSRAIDCVYCKGSHKSFECANITNVMERRAILQAQRRCFNCTRTGHTLKECKSKNLCFHCKGKHHSSICTRTETAQSFGVTSPAQGTRMRDSNGHIRNGPAAYQTVQAKIGGQVCRILLDGGSGKSYISREHGRKLASKPIRSENRIIGTVNGEMEVTCPIYELEVKGIGEAKGHFTSEFAELDLYMLTSVPNAHPEKQKKKYAHLQGIWFSDVSNEENLPIHAILGVKDYAHVRTGHMIKGKYHEPMAEETILGWTLMGAIQEQTGNSQHSVTNLMIEQPKTINEDFKKLYDLDVLGIKDDKSDVYEEFKDSISRDKDGRYSVKLPWKKGNFCLPRNKALCESRLKGQLKRLRRSPEDLRTYDDIIQQQLKEGIVEQVPNMPDGKHIHYIPHHPVIRREAETTKLRIVYDCSARERKYDKSLNDCLHIGPPLQPLLYDILIRFRTYPVALLGDIKQAFLQIKVDPKDRDTMRFLWPKDVWKENSDYQELRFTRVIFGSGPSPFLLGATIREHINQYKEQDPEFVAAVQNSLFVDDLACGGKDIAEVNALKQKLGERFKDGHFIMRKWKSNAPELREIEPTMTKEKGIQGKAQMDKVLGVPWNQNTDLMAVSFEKVSTLEHEPTQRGILRTVAAIYDPLGVASPVSILAKTIYHEVCLTKNGWDGKITDELLKKWQKWLRSIQKYPIITFRRCLLSYPKEEVVGITLHGFADSSVSACCAVIYLEIIQTSGTYVKQLTAKSRVAKPNTTVPRLELIGAQMLTKLIVNVKATLSYNVKETFGWLDSQTALCWLDNEGEWKQFVRKRVDQILQAGIQWRYCPTEDNPADVGTRGTTPELLQNCNKWWEGPQWLTTRHNWPQRSRTSSNEEVEEERRGTTVITTTTDVAKGRIGQSINAYKYSSGRKLFRITAWVLRFVNNIKRNSQKGSYHLTIDEVKAAETLWIKHTQHLFQPTKEQVNQLGLKTDQDKVLRCHGRFNQQEDQQPIYVPKGDQLSALLIMDAHRRVLHMGVASTLAELRSRFWVPNGRQEVKKVIKSCYHCKRYNAQPFKQPLTAPIPNFRTTPGYAFQTTGVDFAGPLHYKDGKNQKKAYITLFTCATSRALHIELVGDMTAKTFRKSLKGLITRRGTPKLMVSDNAKTFKATAQWLQSVFKDTKVRDLLQNEDIQWKFNLSRSPWWGGFFERMVGLVKDTLKKSLGHANLTFSELQELLLDIEFCLNNRPLTYQTEGLDNEVLTPNHLVHGRRMKSLRGEEVYSDEDQIPAKKRLRYLQKCREKYWNRWTKEYLTSLREHHKIHQGGSNKITQGDIVLVKDENLPRNRWKLGKVLTIIRGKDGVERGVTLKTTTGGRPYEIDRPVQSLYPLELRAEAIANAKEKTMNPNEAAVKARSRRRAALDARNVIKAVQLSEEENQI